MRDVFFGDKESEEIEISVGLDIWGREGFVSLLLFGFFLWKEVEGEVERYDGKIA